MNKTVTSNIAGFIFHMDENAFHKLEQYLGKIRNYFAGSEGEDEIISGIEERIAEMFQAKKKEVIGMPDVEEMIGIMGQPEAFMDEDMDDEPAPKRQSSKYSTRDTEASKRVYRDQDDKVLGGVCSGVSYYLGINEPLWFRLAFLLALLFGGTGLFLYIILWVIIPEAETPAQKLEMKGQKINAENIGKAVSTEIDSVKKKWNEEGDGHPVKKVGGFIHRFISLIGRLIIGLLNVLGKILGFLLLMFGVISVISLLSIPFGLPTMISLGNDGVVSSYIVQDILSNLVGGSIMLFWITVSILLIAGIPLLVLAFIGTKMLFNYKSHNKGIAVSMAGLWTLGIVISFVISMVIASDFSSEGNKTQTVELELNSDDDKAILLALNHELGDDEPTFEAEIFGLDLVASGSSNEIYGRPVFDINRAESGGPKLIVKRLARAHKKQEAVERATNIEYGFLASDTSLLLNGYFSIPEGEVWRTQNVELELLLPVGYTVYLSDEMKDIIYDIDNVANTYDGDMLGRRWTMTPDGLACVDCEGLENDDDYEGDWKDDSDIRRETIKTQKAALQLAKEAIRAARKELRHELRGADNLTEEVMEGLEEEMERLDEEMEDLNGEMEDLEERMQEGSKGGDEEDGEEAYFFESEDEDEDEEASTERILLKRVINASYWVDPTTFRKVTLTYPG
ncbi:MAG: phage shock protein PspC (stress-responsive transcriptional regulator) [Oceanospirillaceae bacterium]|jgi:phage shock protein PspC (stress-responsive transcriptional regulator)